MKAKLEYGEDLLIQQQQKGQKRHHPLLLEKRESWRPTSYDEQELNEELLQSSIVGFATFGVKEDIKTHTKHLMLRQLFDCTQNNTDELIYGPKGLGAMKQKQLEIETTEVIKGYLQNIQSICYPEGLTFKRIRYGENGIASVISSESSSQNILNLKQKITQSERQQHADEFIIKETTDITESQSKHESSYKELKHSTAQVINYSITTCLGVKRYLSCLLCFEPEKQNDDNTLLNPFVYCLIQSTPGLDFARDFLLEGIHRRVLLPKYKLICKEPLTQENFIHCMRIECFLSYLFVTLCKREQQLCSNQTEEITLGSKQQNRQYEAITTSICGLNRRGRHITHERLVSQKSSHAAALLYPSGNLSFKTFLRVAYQSPKVIVQVINCILLERKIVIVSPSSSLHHMRRNAIFIETLMELISPMLAVRQVYMNISYISESMIDFLDSPVPYLIGMGEVLWDKIGFKKWEESCRNSDDIVVLKLDGEIPELLMQEGSETESLITCPMPLIEQISLTIFDIAEKVVASQEVQCQKLGDRDTKVYLKQAILNYLLLIYTDLKQYFNFDQQENPFGMTNFSQASSKNSNQNEQEFLKFDFRKYITSKHESFRPFYSALASTQLLNELLYRIQSQIQSFDKHDRIIEFLLTCWDSLNLNNQFSDLQLFQSGLINTLQKDLHQSHIRYKLKDLEDCYSQSIALNPNSRAHFDATDGVFAISNELVLNQQNPNLHMMSDQFMKLLQSRQKANKNVSQNSSNSSSKSGGIKNLKLELNQKPILKRNSGRMNQFLSENPFLPIGSNDPLLYQMTMDSEVPNERSTKHKNEVYHEEEQEQFPQVQILEGSDDDEGEYGAGNQQKNHQGPSTAKAGQSGAFKGLNFSDATSSVTKLRYTVITNNPSELLIAKDERQQFKTPMVDSKQFGYNRAKTADIKINHEEVTNKDSSAFRNFFIETFEKIQRKLSLKNNANKDDHNDEQHFEISSPKLKQQDLQSERHPIKIYDLEKDSTFKGNLCSLNQIVPKGKKKDSSKATIKEVALQLQQYQTQTQQQSGISRHSEPVFGPKQGVTFGADVDSNNQSTKPQSASKQLQRLSNQLTLSSKLTNSKIADQTPICDNDDNDLSRNSPKGTIQSSQTTGNIRPFTLTLGQTHSYAYIVDKDGSPRLPLDPILEKPSQQHIFSDKKSVPGQQKRHDDSTKNHRNSQRVSSSILAQNLFEHTISKINSTFGNVCHSSNVYGAHENYNHTTLFKQSKTIQSAERGNLANQQIESKGYVSLADAAKKSKQLVKKFNINLDLGAEEISDTPMAAEHQHLPQRNSQPQHSLIATPKGILHSSQRPSIPVSDSIERKQGNQSQALLSTPQTSNQKAAQNPAQAAPDKQQYFTNSQISGGVQAMGTLINNSSQLQKKGNSHIMNMKDTSSKPQTPKNAIKLSARDGKKQGVQNLKNSLSKPSSNRNSQLNVKNNSGQTTTKQNTMLHHPEMSKFKKHAHDIPQQLNLDNTIDLLQPEIIRTNLNQQSSVDLQLQLVQDTSINCNLQVVNDSQFQSRLRSISHQLSQPDGQTIQAMRG